MLERANPLLQIFERAISLRRAIKIRINDRTRVAHFAIKLHDCISRTLILFTFSLFQSSISLEIVVSFHKLNLTIFDRLDHFVRSSMAKKRILSVWRILITRVNELLFYIDTIYVAICVQWRGEKANEARSYIDELVRDVFDGITYRTSNHSLLWHSIHRIKLNSRCFLQGNNTIILLKIEAAIL